MLLIKNLFSQLKPHFWVIFEKQTSKQNIYDPKKKKKKFKFSTKHVNSLCMLTHPSVNPMFMYIFISSCVGQFCPMFKLCGRRPGPILSSFIQIEQGRAQPNIRCEGKRISEDSQPKNGQNYRPRRGGAYL